MPHIFNAWEFSSVLVVTIWVKAISEEVYITTFYLLVYLMSRMRSTINYNTLEEGKTLDL